MPSSVLGLVLSCLRFVTKVCLVHVVSRRRDWSRFAAYQPGLSPHKFFTTTAQGSHIQCKPLALFSFNTEQGDHIKPPSFSTPTEQGASPRFPLSTSQSDHNTPHLIFHYPLYRVTIPTSSHFPPPLHRLAISAPPHLIFHHRCTINLLPHFPPLTISTPPPPFPTHTTALWTPSLISHPHFTG